MYSFPKAAGSMTKKNLLVTTELLDGKSAQLLSKYATILQTGSLGEGELAELLPSVDGLMIFSWPKFLTQQNLGRMARLRFIQSILAGVNQVPFSQLDKRVIVASNAGAYSGPVGEYAWALLLSAAKRVVEHHTAIREGRGMLVRHGDAAQGIRILSGKTLGILGYGGIGAATARMAKGFGMKILGFTRRAGRDSRVTLLKGKRGFHRILSESDAIVLALPLTKATTRIVNRESLSAMKPEMILVNIARGELVDEKGLYEHLKANPGFRYASDVWWFREGKESLTTDYNFASLHNFIGTPHVSGPSGLTTGLPIKMAVENTLRFLTNRSPRNVVDPLDYTG